MINIIIYIGIFMSFFLSLLVLVKNNRLVHDYLLAIWLILNGANLSFFYYNFSKTTTDVSHLEIVGALLPFITSPLLYVYVSALVKLPPFRLYRYLYHFIPFVVMVVSVVYFFNLDSSEYSINVSRGFIQQSGSLPFNIRHYGLILAFFSFLYPMLSLGLLFKHRSRIENEFSNVEKINLNWLRYWIIISISGFWISFIIIWVAQYDWVDYLTSFQTVATQLTLNIVIIGFYGLRQTTIFSNLQTLADQVHTVKNEEKYKTSLLKKEESSALLFKIQEYMKTEKPYLSSQLNIESLASQLHLTKHDLSQVINEQLGLNFFNFVNQYRVKEVKERIANKKYRHLTLLAIAFETGFNSKSSFNHIFKKVEGITPSEYKRQLSGN